MKILVLLFILGKHRKTGVKAGNKIAVIRNIYKHKTIINQIQKLQPKNKKPLCFIFNKNKTI